MSAFAQKAKQDTSSAPKQPVKTPAPHAGHPGPMKAGNAALGGLLTDSDSHPIPPALRERMEASFGEPFGDVRIHPRDPSADALDAVAYTENRDVHLSPEAPPLESDAGARLLGHELAHVVQQRSAAGISPGVGTRGDALEAEAGQASMHAAAGMPATVSAGAAAPAVQCQRKADLLSGALTVISQYLDREWLAQSKKRRAFKLNDSVKKNLLLIWNKAPFPPQALITKGDREYDTPLEFLQEIQDKVPENVDPMVIRILNRAPQTEAKEEKIDAPEPSKDDEAVLAAAKRALQEFLKTKQGQQLAQHAKRFFLSAEGIALAFIVAGGVATAVAANDAEIPDLPEIPLGHGLKLKVELKRKDKPEELPKELRHLFAPQDPNAKGPEAFKAGITLTAEVDLEDVIRAIGKFFAVIGVGIAKGVVKIGTVIGETMAPVGRFFASIGRGIVRGLKAILPDLKIMASTVTAGALIGGLAGGWIGAGIGAAIGVGVGLIGSLIRRLF